MNNEKNSVFINLEEYLPVKSFRIVPESALEYTHPKHQVKVEIVRFVKQVTINSPVSGKLRHDLYETSYGFVFNNPILEEGFKALGCKIVSEGLIILRDNKDNFSLQMIGPEGEKTFLVRISDVNYLFDNCLVPNV